MMSVQEVYKRLDERVVLLLEGKEPKEVYEDLDKIYNCITDLMNKNKWDEAYQMCRRWNICLEWLKRQTLTDKNVAQMYYSSKMENDVESLFKEIKLEIEIDCLRRQRKLETQSKLNMENVNEITCADASNDKVLPSSSSKHGVQQLISSQSHQTLHRNEELLKVAVVDESASSGGLAPKKRKSTSYESLLHLFVDYVTPEQEAHAAEEIAECVQMLRSGNVRNTTMFQSMVKNRLIRILPILLACNDDVNFIDYRGQTILHIFIWHYADKGVFPHTEPARDREFIKILMEKGASVDIADNTKNTPVHYAASVGRGDLVLSMLNHFTGVSVTNNKGHTVLHVLVNSYIKKPGRIIIEAVRALLSKITNFRTMESSWRPSLYAAIRYCLIRVIEAFGMMSNFSENLLLCICQTAAHWPDHHRKELPHLVRLLNLDASVRKRDKDNFNTPLHYVARANRIEAVEMFLNAGADVDARSLDGTTPLHLAVMEDHLGIVELLIDRRADLHARDAIFNFGLMHMAACKGDERAIDLLVEHGLSVEDEAVDGLRPLHLAALAGNERAVRRLIYHGADVNCRTRKLRSTPLHSLWMKHESIGPYSEGDLEYSTVAGMLLTEARAKPDSRMNAATALLRAEANANARDAELQTALHHVASMRMDVIEKQEFLEILLENGARADVANAYNVSPLNVVLVIDRQWADGLSVLLRYGADLNDFARISDIWGYEVELFRYLRLLEAIDMPITSVSVTPSLNEWHSELDSDEVQRLKDHRLMDDGTSMYDFLHMDSKRRYRLAETVLSLDLKSEYKNYHVVIENSCRRAIIEKMILNLASSALSQLAGFNLPDICTEKIFNFMSVKEMTAFVDIVESWAF